MHTPLSTEAIIVQHSSIHSLIIRVRASEFPLQEVNSDILATYLIYDNELMLLTVAKEEPEIYSWV